MTTRNSLIVAAVLLAISTLALAKGPTPFDRLISQIIAQLEQQSESDQRLIDQTITLRKSLQAAEDRRSTNQFPVSRDSVLAREALVAANEMISNPNRTKLLFDTFLRNTLDRQEELLQLAIEGPATTRLTTARLAAQTKARKAVLSDLRRDVESLRKFPTSKERLNFLVENVQLIANAIKERGAVPVPQP